MKKTKLSSNIKLVSCFLAALFLSFASCKDKEVNTDSEDAAPTDVVAPAYSFSRFDGNGLFKVQRTYAYWNNASTGLIETISTEASARYKISPFDSLQTDMGSVRCQGTFLTLQNSLTYLVNGTAANLIWFSDTIGVLWDVSGNNANGISSFSFVSAKSMPVYLGVSNNSIPGTISRTMGTKVPLGANVLGADSIFISLTVGQKSIQRTVGGTVPFCEFSNTELSVLASSAGINALLQISPINFDVSQQGGKKIYFANQASYTKFVEVK